MVAPPVPVPGLTDSQLGPYIAELRNVCDAAQSRFETLRGAQVGWIRARRRRAARHAARQPAEEETARSIEEQTRLFDEVEGFLSLWARASLLLFPIGGARTWRERRGRDLRRRIGVPLTSLLADRELRNAWMHFDERLDSLVEAGGAINLQAFTESGVVTQQIIDRTLRLVEMDTLRLHYHRQDGTTAAANLNDLASELRWLVAMMSVATAQ
jgi:hypothetical protein